MTVRNERNELRGFLIAATLIAPFLLAGCATPFTHLEWGTQRNGAHAKAAPRSNYENRRYAADVPVPTARPTWYEQSHRPSWYDDRRDYDSRPVTRPDYAYGDARFSWPVKGRVVSEFGSFASGERNDGINIAANYGDPIRAAADGTVSYEGNELRSYGNLVLMRHDNGYVTAYAHADHFIVNKGDRIARGQVIGYVGSSGDVRSPQLHFELRRGARDPIDPRPMLSSQQVASRY